MFYDLNVRWPVTLPSAPSLAAGAKKAAAKEKKAAAAAAATATSASSAAGTITSSTSVVSQLTPRQRTDLNTLLLDSIDLGFQIVALNFHVKTRFDGAVHRAGSFTTHDGVLNPPFPALDPRCRPSPAASNEPQILQLSRLTLLMDDDSMGKHGDGFTATNQAALCAYDLLAAQPCNDASLSHVCLSMTELKPFSVDIITLDFSASARPPFFLRRSLVNAAIANGAVFEICYAPVVHAQQQSTSSSTEESTAALSSKARRNIISATRDLLRATNGRGVILSSGASDLLGLRGPYDVINLAAVLGMNPTAARDAVSSTCRALVLRAETRKSFRGVVGDARIVVAVSDRQATKDENLSEGREQLPSMTTDAPVTVDALQKKRKQVPVGSSQDGRDGLHAQGKKRKQKHTQSSSS